MKQVIIINGNCGVGKDTMIEFAKRKFKIRNVSSIDPIKEIARIGGWREKDEKGRRLLVNLKELFIEFNDLPTNYLIKQYNQFLKSDEHLMFAHIREPEEIDKFKKISQAKTLLITRSQSAAIDCGRNNVKYTYDFLFANDGDTISENGENFIKFLFECLFK
ncbi:MAG: hypothetical protein FWE01_00325 [Firmicutes bacterium]|nr:hypothetical protein [Bacillota bacterium]